MFYLFKSNQQTKTQEKNISVIVLFTLLQKYSLKDKITMWQLATIKSDTVCRFFTMAYLLFDLFPSV